jgi:hypothetical protein
MPEKRSTHCKPKKFPHTQIKKNQSLCFRDKMQVIVPLKQKKIAADSQLRC